MRIWYFHPYGSALGRGKYLRPYYLAREWQRMGHTAVCFVSRNHHLMDDDAPMPVDETVGGVRFISLRARSYLGNGLGRFLNMMDFCLAMTAPPRDLPRPDAIIVSSPHPFVIFSGWLLSKRTSARLIFEVRDLWPLSIIAMTSMPKWHPITILSWVAEQFAYRRSHLVASLLGNAEPYMRGRGLRGRFVHVPNAYSDDAAGVPKDPVTEHGKLAAKTIAEWRKEGRLILIHPGTQGYPSALDILLEAVATAKTKNSLGVLLVGGGDTAGSLKALASKLNLVNDVAFIPPVPKGESLWLTAQCDIGYAGKRNFGTVFQHGISFNKIIDFMQAGLPVILPVTTKGDPVSESGCGIVTGDDPQAVADAILQLSAMSPAERSGMGKRGSEYATAKLSYVSVAADYIAAINAS